MAKRRFDQAIARLGAEVLAQPVIRISDPPDWQGVDSVLDRLNQFDWIVFSSANGVQYFIERLLNMGGDFGQLRRAKLAAIGPATSDALLRHRLLADVIPPEFRAESLADVAGRPGLGQTILVGSRKPGTGNSGRTIKIGRCESWSKSSLIPAATWTSPILILLQNLRPEKSIGSRSPVPRLPAR